MVGAGVVLDADPTLFLGPRKRSIAIAGHETSVSLEPIFWRALEAAAAERALPVSALVAGIDALRVAACPAPNLASAIRTWLFATYNANLLQNRVDLENGSQ